MKITLIRHGETIENATGIIQGQNQGTLSDKGIQQAENIAHQLSDTTFDIAISSDLKRCVDTANIILKHHEDLQLRYAPELREMHFGDYQGLKNSDVDWDLLPGGLLERKAPNGESGMEMRRRVLSYINDLFIEYPTKSLLIITHGGPIRAIVSSIEGIDPSESLNIEVNNCSIYTYTVVSNLPIED